MPTLPEYLMIFPVFVKFTLLVFYVCGVRVKSCLFVVSLLFLLSLFVQSLYCHIFGTMMFWIIRLVASVFVCRCLCNILLYLDQIALSMFHQQKRSYVGKCYDCTSLPPKETTEIAPTYHQKQRQKVTTWRLFNFLNPVIWIAVNYLRRGILTLCKGRTL